VEARTSGLPVILIVWADRQSWLRLEQNQVPLPAEVRHHFHEDLPIESSLIQADSAPVGDVLEYLKRDGIDRALRLSGANAACYEPAAHKILNGPGESRESDNRLARGIGHEESPHSEQ
jgi:hypothetical protein